MGGRGAPDPICHKECNENNECGFFSKRERVNELYRNVNNHIRKKIATIQVYDVGIQYNLMTVHGTLRLELKFIIDKL